MTITLELLEKLIAYPTVSSESNLGIISFIRSFLQERGFEVHQIDDPIEKKSGLFASIGPNTSGGILLSGHTDVVPTIGQNWTRPEFSLTLEDNRAYGRGTTDMKGFVASMLYAADLASKSQLNQPLKLVFSYDEEIGCVGIKKMIGKLESTIGLADLAIVGEPTAMQVAIGHKGKSAIRATCVGESGHSSLAPNFVNALHLATDFVDGLRRLQKELEKSGARDEHYDIPYSTVHVGKLQGGIALNIIPDSAVVDFEFRHLAADSSKQILEKISTIAEKTAARYRTNFPDAAILLDRYNTYPGLDVAENNDVISQVQHLAQSNSTTKVAFGTEAGYFDGLGISSVVCGPGVMEEQGHKPDEHITLDQLHACDAMMMRVVQKLSK